MLQSFSNLMRIAICLSLVLDFVSCQNMFGRYQDFFFNNDYSNDDTSQIDSTPKKSGKLYQPLTEVVTLSVAERSVHLS